MSIINQHIKRWLARLEIKAATTPWADRHAAHHRNTRRALVEICEAIREQLALMGFDPALAVSLRCGERAAIELAAIPDSETLRAADAAIMRSDQHVEGATSSIIAAQVASMAAHFRDGSEPDLAHASLAELFAFCLSLGGPVLKGEALARVGVSRMFRNSILFVDSPMENKYVADTIMKWAGEGSPTREVKSWSRRSPIPGR
jgi:hypothetical protein